MVESEAPLWPIDTNSNPAGVPMWDQVDPYRLQIYLEELLRIGDTTGTHRLNPQQFLRLLTRSGTIVLPICNW